MQPPDTPPPETATPPLTFVALRDANRARLPLFKNKHGQPAHSEPDGSDWSLGEWCNAVLGELGEAANLIKKVKRGDVTLDEARPELAKEYADVATYLDILAFRTGVDLGEATAAKWDEVSARVGVSFRIADFLGLSVERAAVRRFARWLADGHDEVQREHLCASAEDFISESPPLAPPSSPATPPGELKHLRSLALAVVRSAYDGGHYCGVNANALVALREYFEEKATEAGL